MVCITLIIGNTMNGSITWDIPMMMPVSLNSSCGVFPWLTTPRLTSVELMTPVPFSRMNQPNDRTTRSMVSGASVAMTMSFPIHSAFPHRGVGEGEPEHEVDDGHDGRDLDRADQGLLIHRLRERPGVVDERGAGLDRALAVGVEAVAQQDDRREHHQYRDDKERRSDEDVLPEAGALVLVQYCGQPLV
jgi:hypothetical protein